MIGFILYFFHWRFYLMTSVWFVCDFFMGFLAQKLLTERLKMKETLQNSNWFHDLQTEVITRIADSSQKCWNCWNIWQLKRTHKKIIRPSQESKNIMNIRKSYEHQKIIWKSYEIKCHMKIIQKYMEISTCQKTDFLWRSFDFSQFSRFQWKLGGSSWHPLLWNGWTWRNLCRLPIQKIGRFLSEIQSVAKININNIRNSYGNYITHKSHKRNTRTSIENHTNIMRNSQENHTSKSRPFQTTIHHKSKSQVNHITILRKIWK